MPERRGAQAPWHARYCEVCGKAVNPARATVCAARGEPIHCITCKLPCSDNSDDA